MQARYLNPVTNREARHTARPTAPAAIVRAGVRTWGTLRLWWRRSRQRTALRTLVSRDAHFFHDIGVSRATVYNEGSKWFWQA